jgi:hypothetical protein
MLGKITRREEGRRKEVEWGEISFTFYLSPPYIWRGFFFYFFTAGGTWGSWGDDEREREEEGDRSLEEEKEEERRGESGHRRLLEVDGGR